MLKTHQESMKCFLQSLKLMATVWMKLLKKLKGVL